MESGHWYLYDIAQRNGIDYNDCIKLYKELRMINRKWDFEMILIYIEYFIKFANENSRNAIELMKELRSVPK